MIAGATRLVPDGIEVFAIAGEWNTYHCSQKELN